MVLILDQSVVTYMEAALARMTKTRKNRNQYTIFQMTIGDKISIDVLVCFETWIGCLTIVSFEESADRAHLLQTSDPCLKTSRDINQYLSLN